jgi:GntR family transcriptional regulator, colanic acid and biofilm gene transcriptional regulator
VTIKPLEQGNLSARAYSALKDALIAGTFGPGERIVMQDLAERLGTSVTPVREACLRLVSEQGLEIRSGRFVTVPDLDLARYMELRIVRLALEGLAAELAAKDARAPEIDRLTEIQGRFESARLAGDSRGAIEMNREFHFGVYRLSRMEILLRQIEVMWISMGPILKVYHEEVITDYVGADEHVHLIAALRRRDGPAARLALERDIVRGGEGILRHLSSLQEAAAAEG